MPSHGYIEDITEKGRRGGPPRQRGAPPPHRGERARRHLDDGPRRTDHVRQPSVEKLRGTPSPRRWRSRSRRITRSPRRSASGTSCTCSARSRRATRNDSRRRGVLCKDGYTSGARSWRTDTADDGSSSSSGRQRDIGERKRTRRSSSRRTRSSRRRSASRTRAAGRGTRRQDGDVVRTSLGSTAWSRERPARRASGGPRGPDDLDRGDRGDRCRDRRRPAVRGRVRHRPRGRRPSPRGRPWDRRIAPDGTVTGTRGASRT